MHEIGRYTVFRLAAGLLALIGCYIVPLEHQQSFAYVNPTDTAMRPPKDAKKVGDKYDGFYFRIWDSLAKDEFAERVVLRVMATDGSDKIVELNLDGRTQVQMEAYSEEDAATPPPANKQFDVEIAVDYLPKTSDGTPGEPVHWADTVSMNIPFGADLIVAANKDGSFLIQPVPNN